ncbi:hypothetical protein GRF29_106g1561500 [Pseudopithomyces chartarum]|uniref:Protein transport protein SEC13 n=1 Tax=Pseudopithomyces chartarum TaxID=1892770 RepID=A0AAN6LTB2_9PLEO|nr:hypothetical protein GRF29_106g1561500 [Pseudopithomyces chartarum]
MVSTTTPRTFRISAANTPPPFPGQRNNEFRWPRRHDCTLTNSPIPHTHTRASAHRYHESSPQILRPGPLRLRSGRQPPIDLISDNANDMQHDAVLDYYGRRLATCSSDKTIKIFEVENESHRLVETLKGHEGAVWCVAWAHPKYGNILASSSYDGKVLIWREQNAAWQKIYDVALHSASVNLVAWAPHEAGCLLACASSDGNVSVLEFKDNAWSHQIFQACGSGVNSRGEWIVWEFECADGSHGLGAGCGVESDGVVQVVHCECESG